MSNEPDLTEIDALVLKEREAVRSAAREAIRTTAFNPMVKYALASVLKSSSLRSYEGRSKPVGVECFNPQEDIPALVQDLEQSGDIGYAISVQESYLNGLGIETSQDVWKVELKRYYDLYQHFRTASNRSLVQQSRLPACLLNDCLPFLETTSVRQAAVRHLPCTTAKDIFGRNLLHIALYSGYISGVDELIGRLSKTELNAKDFFGRSPLHVAATFGLDFVVQWLLEAGVDASPREKSHNLTPLQCAAAAGHEGTMTSILARLVATRPGGLGIELQAACAFASRNRHGHIVRKLLPRLTKAEQAALRAAMASASAAHASSRRTMAPVDTGTGSGYDFIPELTRHLAASRDSG
jgi:ankyrin repeat protein